MDSNRLVLQNICICTDDSLPNSTYVFKSKPPALLSVCKIQVSTTSFAFSSSDLSFLASSGDLFIPNGGPDGKYLASSGVIDSYSLLKVLVSCGIAALTLNYASMFLSILNCSSKSVHWSILKFLCLCRYSCIRVAIT